MSLERARKAFNLEETGEFAQFEIIEQPKFIQSVSGLDPYDCPMESYAKTYRTLDIDFVLRLPVKSYRPRTGEGNVVVDEEGNRLSRWGVAVGSIWESTLPFKTVDEVLAYDPFSCSAGEYRLVLDADPNRTVAEMAAEMQSKLDNQRKYAGSSFLLPGANYFVLFHYFVTTFGYELYTEAALCYPREFEKLLDKFAELSYKLSEAWAKTDIEVFVAHDDIAMNASTIFSPDWLRKNIFPRYAEILSPLKRAGKKVIYFTDGDFRSVLGDLDTLDPDGYVFEPQMDLSMMVNRYGGRKVLMGNADVRTLTFGSEKEIRDEVERCLSIGAGVPGYFVSVTGSIPQNIPLNNVRFYFDEISRWRTHLKSSR
jgi:hypothetical protein